MGGRCAWYKSGRSLQAAIKVSAHKERVHPFTKKRPIGSTRPPAGVPVISSQLNLGLLEHVPETGKVTNSLSPPATFSDVKNLGKKPKTRAHEKAKELLRTT